MARTIRILLALMMLSGCSLLPAGHRKLVPIEHQYDPSEPQFRRSIGALLGPVFHTGNKITPLLNGAQIFPAMLEAIRGAKRSIDFETFIYWKGEIGSEFSKALCERAGHGVKVRVLLDWFGSSQIDPKYVESMKASGVKVAYYHPLRWYDIHRLDARTHRKILVIDGRIGFTGGVGIADEWAGNAQNKNHWRDNHYKLEGPAVAALQSAFMDNWIKTEGEVLDGEDYFPQLGQAGGMDAQILRSAPREGTSSARLLYLLSIAAASKSLLIETPYFVPDKKIIMALEAAARRGVDVRIIVPGPQIDYEIVRAASREDWGELIAAGVKIFEYEPTMFHCKLMIVDGRFTVVGSTNIDNRSFNLNEEVSLNVLDQGFAQQQTKIFEDDMTRTKPVRGDRFEHRGWWKRFSEWVARPIRGEL